MHIEKINENQIRCTLTKEDLAQRQLKLNELTYGSAKARELFKDMMTQAYEELGFESSNIPLMIEAIPVSSDCLVLIITKVEDPEEFDTRFSRFSRNGNHGEEDPGLAHGAELPDTTYSSPGFSNLLEEDPEALHYEEDPEAAGSHDQLSVSDDSDGYHFSSTRKDGDFETTLEISIEKDGQDGEESVPVDLFNMSAEEMLTYLAKRAREIREDLGQGQNKTGRTDPDSSRQDLPALEYNPDNNPRPESDQKDGASNNFGQNDETGKDSGLDEADKPVTAPGIHPGGRTGKAGKGTRSGAAASRKDFRCYYFSSFSDISRLCAVLYPFYKGMSSLYRDPSEGSYYLLLRRGDSDKNHFKRACTLAADFGKSLDLSYGTDFYFREHFRIILAEDAVAQTASLL